MKRYLHLLLVGAALTFSILACRVVSIAPRNPAPEPSPSMILTPETTVPLPSIPDYQAIEDILVNLYEEVSPGVVAIRVLTRTGDGLGSGFVIDKEGHILTNYHVVEGVTDLAVDFPSGLKVRGRVIGTDLDSDLAVIKVDVDPEFLHPLRLGNAQDVKVGQTAIAIGNPFSLNSTMTVGIVSAIGRHLDSMRAAPGGGFYAAGDLIQTDTSINPGNSGGPLLNLRGEVIGVNRAIRTESFTAQGEPVNSGIGFAISIGIAKRVVPSLIEIGKYDYPYMGISGTQEISLIDQEELGLPRSTGVYIIEVTPNSPALRAGLIQGDLIIAMDGWEVRTFSEMLTYLLNHTIPGDIVSVTFLRDGREMEVELTLGARPE
jgi:S1-C subfamily serine protease